MEYQVKELTPKGIDYAKRFLNDAREGRATDVPEDLLTNDRYTSPTHTECFVEKHTFHTRRDAGKYLSLALRPLGIGYVNGNYPLWSWLGIYYFDTLVEREELGNFRLGRLPEQAFIIDADHLNPRDILFNRLMLAWETYCHHGDQYASWMLDQPVMSISKLVERTIRSHQRFASNGIVKLIGLLYIDQATGRVRTRAGADDAVGGIRRLNDVLDQLYMTYDVYGMSAKQLLALLPEEFKRFNVEAGSARN